MTGWGAASLCVAFHRDCSRVPVARPSRLKGFAWQGRYLRLRARDTGATTSQNRSRHLRAQASGRVPAHRRCAVGPPARRGVSASVGSKAWARAREWRAVRCRCRSAGRQRAALTGSKLCWALLSAACARCGRRSLCKAQDERAPGVAARRDGVVADARGDLSPGGCIYGVLMLRVFRDFANLMRASRGLGRESRLVRARKAGCDGRALREILERRVLLPG
jgi:hypothetical protein